MSGAAEDDKGGRKSNPMGSRTSVGVWMGTDEAALRYESALNRAHKISVSEVQKLEAVGGLHMSMASAEADILAYLDRVNYMAQIDGNIGILDINGVLTADYEYYNKYVGLVSYDEIAFAAKALTLAAKAGTITAVIMRISSPGGDASGIETGDAALRELAKAVPVYTYAAKEMCSAGYWMGCHAKEIWTAKLAQVGSIGVVAYLRTMTGAMEMAGVKIRVLREGEFKAELNPYEEPSEEAIARAQEQMRIMYDMFTGHTADQRGMTTKAMKEGPGRGQGLLGIQALKEGLVDKLANYETLVKFLRTEYSPEKSGGSSPKAMANSGSNPMKLFKKDGKTYVLNEKGLALLASGMSEDDAAMQEDTLKEHVEGQANDEQQEPVIEKPPVVETPPVNQPAAANVDGMMALMEKVSGLSQKLGGVERDLVTATSQLEAARENNTQLRTIAVKAINRMEIGMNMPVSKATEFDSDSAVVSKFQKLETSFNTMFKQGPKAEHSTDLNLPARGATPASGSVQQEAAQNLTKIG